MLIRPASAADAAAISSLMLGESHHITLQPDGQGAEAILASMREPAVLANVASPQFAYWVALIDGGVQGVISLRDGSHLYQMFVPTRLHGRGIGRQLWNHLLSTLGAELQPSTITVRASTFGLPAYQQLGFVATGPRTESHGVAYVPMAFNRLTASQSSLSTSQET